MTSLSIVESEIRKFLDKNFYNSTEFDSVHRNLIRDIGPNIVLMTSDKYRIFNEFIEERYAVKFTNLTVNSFALELSKLNEDKEVIPGWFLQDNAEYILIVYIYANVFNWTSITEDNIQRLEVLLVPREAIINKLKEYNIVDIFDIDKKIRLGELDDIKTNNINNEYWFHFNASTKIVNLVIRREVYKKLSIIDRVIMNKNVNNG